MSYNSKYNTRNSSGRYNTPGQFVPAGDLGAGGASAGGQQQQRYAKSSDSSQFGQNTPLRKPQSQNLTPIQPAPPQQAPPLPAPPLPSVAAPAPPPTVRDDDIKMEDVEDPTDNSYSMRPFWMKGKLIGVRKISNKERRRRQNEHLRRLLTPKNALMVLNEMTRVEQQIKVEPAVNNQYYKASNQKSFCADLTIEGVTYKGYGENKIIARNAAAEQAIRDLIIKKMSKPATSAPSSTTTSTSEGEGSTNGDGAAGEEALPMIQLASFALHKLFTEWEYEGHKVPQLKHHQLATTFQDNGDGSRMDTAEGGAEPAGPKPRGLPANAAAMHPCMLLTYMRPRLEYRELAVEGDKPQNMLFTLGVDVDGATYIGKASNKREARKQAAKSACQALFGVEFEPNASANTPVPAK